MKGMLLFVGVSRLRTPKKSTLKLKTEIRNLLFDLLPTCLNVPSP